VTKSDVAIYSASGIELTLPLDRERETVWATQAQIEELFGVDQSGVSRHIRNLLRDGELDEESNMQKMHSANFTHPEDLNFKFVQQGAAQFPVTPARVQNNRALLIIAVDEGFFA